MSSLDHDGHDNAAHFQYIFIAGKQDPCVMEILSGLVIININIYQSNIRPSTEIQSPGIFKLSYYLVLPRLLFGTTSAADLKNTDSF